ncbi:MAG TPA: DUF4157 domain-containing protein, partial [Myxococcota bacterium]|nr:DUF4157 domain-containing protein [Myxococcota bacterium]
MQGRSRGAMFDAASKAPSAPLPHRAKMEDRFGQDFSSVRARVGGPDVEAALVSQGASAAARGEEVLFASANPSEEEVAHELTHVVQAREGRATASPEGEAEAHACATGDCGKCAECKEAHGGGAASGNTEQVAFNDGEDRCTELLKLIEQCLNGGGNIKRGLRERWDDLVEDPQGLQWDYWSTPHPK